jgi:hypothetical protein
VCSRVLGKGSVGEIFMFGKRSDNSLVPFRNKDMVRDRITNV